MPHIRAQKGPSEKWGRKFVWVRMRAGGSQREIERKRECVWLNGENEFENERGEREGEFVRK